MGAAFPTVGQKVRVREGECIERYPWFLIEGGTGVVTTSDADHSFIAVTMDDDENLDIGNDEDRESLFNEWNGQAHFNDVPSGHKNAEGGHDLLATAADDFHQCMEVIES